MEAFSGMSFVHMKRFVGPGLKRNPETSFSSGMEAKRDIISLGTKSRINPADVFPVQKRSTRQHPPFKMSKEQSLFT